MNNVESNKQYRNIVQEMLNSGQSEQLYNCIRSLLEDAGDDSSRLVYYLRSKLIHLDIHPESIDVSLKNKPLGTIEVSDIKVGHTRVYTCTVLES